MAVLLFAAALQTCIDMFKLSLQTRAVNLTPSRDPKCRNILGLWQ
jgi:hypothetical protein